MRVNFEYGYKHNEFVAVYIDECGDRQIMPFDTYDQADEFLKTCYCRIGVMTTSFYVHCVTK